MWINPEEQKFRRVTYFSRSFSFFIFALQILYYLTEYIGFSVFVLCFLLFCYMKLETYVTYKPNILRSTFKLATSDLFIEMALKYKRKFTCMIHNKLFTPRASVDFALNWKKLLLLNHNKRTLNDEHASKMLHYRRQKFAKFPVLFLLLIFANLIFSWRKSLVRDRLQILLLILNKFKEIN